MKRTTPPTSTTKEGRAHSTQPSRWTLFFAPIAAIFYTKPVSEQDLAATLEGSRKDIIRSDKAIEESKQLLAEIDARLKSGIPMHNK